MAKLETLVNHAKTDVVSDIEEALSASLALHEYYESLCILRLDSNTLTAQHLNNKTALLNIINELQSMLRR